MLLSDGRPGFFELTLEKSDLICLFISRSSRRFSLFLFDFWSWGSSHSSVGFLSLLHLLPHLSQVVAVLLPYSFLGNSSQYFEHFRERHSCFWTEAVFFQPVQGTRGVSSSATGIFDPLSVRE